MQVFSCYHPPRLDKEDLLQIIGGCSKINGPRYAINRRQRKQINYQTKKEMSHGRFFEERPVQRRAMFEKWMSLQTFSQFERRTVGFVKEDGKEWPGIQFMTTGGQDGGHFFKKLRRHMETCSVEVRRKAVEVS